jgi:hypothetical protein
VCWVRPRQDSWRVTGAVCGSCAHPEHQPPRAIACGIAGQAGTRHGCAVEWGRRPQGHARAEPGELALRKIQGRVRWPATHPPTQLTCEYMHQCWRRTQQQVRRACSWLPGQWGGVVRVRWHGGRVSVGAVRGGILPFTCRNAAQRAAGVCPGACRAHCQAAAGCGGDSGRCNHIPPPNLGSGVVAGW